MLNNSLLPLQNEQVGPGAYEVNPLQFAKMYQRNAETAAFKAARKDIGLMSQNIPGPGHYYQESKDG